MTGIAQKRATKAYRERLVDRGVVRTQLSARAEDRALLRAVARKLTEKGAEADELRRAMEAAVSKQGSTKGEFLASLRRSPLVGTELEFTRGNPAPRRVDL